jgi:hypothetical protein
VAGKYLPAEVKFLLAEPEQTENFTVRLDPADWYCEGGRRQKRSDRGVLFRLTE